MDSVGNEQSRWGWLQDGLRDVGMQVIEAGGDRLATELRNQDKVTVSDEAQPKMTQYGQPAQMPGQPNPVMGTLQAINPQHAVLAVAALVGLLFVARAVK